MEAPPAGSAVSFGTRSHGPAGGLGSTCVPDTEMTDSGPEPTLDGVGREFPDWHCYAPGINSYVFAGLRDSSPLVILRGKDPMALRNEIRRWTDSR